MNVFDEWHTCRGFHGAGSNKTSTLSTSLDVTLTTAGWWMISADVDYAWQGPNASTTSTTVSTTDTHQWAKETRIVYCRDASMHIGMIRSGTTSGTFHVCLLKGV